MKSLLRRHGSEFCAAIDSKDENKVNFLLYDMLAMITPEKAVAWMGHSGYICTGGSVQPEEA